MKNVLVTGGLGFIGHHMVKKLSTQSNLKITVLDIKPIENVKTIFGFNDLSVNSNFENAVDFFSENNQITFISGDIRDREIVLKIFEKEQFDTCIHLAAKVSVVDSISNPEETFATNEYGTLNVLDGCAENLVETFVFASSGAVYGEPKLLPIREDHVLEPISPYGASKVSGEALLCSYVFSGKINKGVSLRFFNVYGEGQNPQYAGVITKFAERLSKGLPPLIYGDGKQTRDFVYVGDIVQALMLAAQSKEVTHGYQTFNVATGKSVNIIELVLMMMKIFDKNLPPIFENERVGEIKDGSANISKIREVLGFKANVDLESGLTIFKNYFTKNLLLQTN
ncbi:MAG: GDP-mannose 4,6-dehydratase [Nitrosopumilaceae archaeon]